MHPPQVNAQGRVRLAVISASGDIDLGLDFRFTLAVPGEVYQEGLLCWAAGSSSWLQGTGRGNATVADLVKKYKASGKLDSDNSLPEENIIDVFSDIGIALKSMPAVDFTYCFVLE
jgi:hypothetical protein